MLNSARMGLEGLSKTTKKIVLNLTMVVLLGLALLFIFLSTRAGDDISIDHTQYQKYLSKFHDKYLKEQMPYRKFAFYQTYDDLIFNQKQLDQKFKKGLNQQYDISQKQFQQLYTIVTAIARQKGYQEIAQFQDDYYYDWEQFMPPVKDMKDYDGSYIFASVALMEFQVNRKQVIEGRKMGQEIELADNWITLSEQEVIDCCPQCLEKKRPRYVFNYILKSSISRDSDYPYVSSVYDSQPGKCKKSGKDEFRIKGWWKKSGCQQLRNRLERGPAVVWVDAREWRNYYGGILETCGTNRNHYALVVGRGIGYWKVRNSWGPLWGQHGHIRLKYGNTCGICSHSTFIDFP